MGLNVSAGDHCNVSCDDVYGIGCRQATPNFLGQEETSLIAEKHGWHKNLHNGNWSCSDCHLRADPSRQRVGGFKTAAEVIAALPFALADILGTQTIQANGERVVIQKHGLNSAVIWELRKRLHNWAFQVNETDTEILAKPI